MGLLNFTCICESLLLSEFMHSNNYIIYWWGSKVERAGFDLMLPVVVQRQYAHIAFEVTVKVVLVACPSCTANVCEATYILSSIWSRLKW